MYTSGVRERYVASDFATIFELYHFFALICFKYYRMEHLVHTTSSRHFIVRAARRKHPTQAILSLVEHCNMSVS